MNHQNYLSHPRPVPLQYTNWELGNLRTVIHHKLSSTIPLQPQQATLVFSAAPFASWPPIARYIYSIDWGTQTRKFLTSLVLKCSSSPSCTRCVRVHGTANMLTTHQHPRVLKIHQTRSFRWETKIFVAWQCIYMGHSVPTWLWKHPLSSTFSMVASAHNIIWWLLVGNMVRTFTRSHLKKLGMNILECRIKKSLRNVCGIKKRLPNKPQIWLSMVKQTVWPRHSQSDGGLPEALDSHNFSSLKKYNWHLQLRVEIRASTSMAITFGKSNCRALNRDRKNR